MTSPVTPPAAPVVPLYPPLGSATFNADAYAYGTAMPGVVDGINDLAENAHTNALSANESATAAQQSALDASNAAAPALAAANFKGLWGDLTGPLSKPACVKHNGRFWMLLNNLADVTASEPGVTADWTGLDAGDVVSEVITSTSMLVGVRYVVKTGGITLTAPGSLQVGDRLSAVDVSGGGFLVYWNGNTVKNDTQTLPMSIPALASFSVTYSGSTLA